MAKRKYVPRVGTVFESRDSLLDRLEGSGWELEGLSTAFSKAGEVLDHNLGVQDRKKNLWLMIRLNPYHGKVKVTRVRKLKISDFSSGGKKCKNKLG